MYLSKLRVSGNLVETTQGTHPQGGLDFEFVESYLNCDWYEDELFRKALRNMHLIYGNPTWMVVRLINNPEAAANQVPYEMAAVTLPIECQGDPTRECMPYTLQD